MIVLLVLLSACYPQESPEPVYYPFLQQHMPAREFVAEEMPEIYEVVEPPEFGCIDSDGGINLKERGVTVDTRRNATDLCSDERYVKEFFCMLGQVSWNLKACPYTDTCIQGRCVTEPTGLCERNEFRCADAFVLQRCSPLGTWVDITRCRFGCVNGTCAGSDCIPSDENRCSPGGGKVQECVKNHWEDVEVCEFGCWQGRCVR